MTTSPESHVDVAAKRYRPYDLRNFRDLPQVQDHLTEAQRWEVEVAGHVFPFKTNNYVVEELIDWSRVPRDPMFVLTFPQRGMLSQEQFERMEEALRGSDDPAHHLEVANSIRHELNPHPAGQMEHNVPDLYGEPLEGMQHKYDETVLFFPSQGQTCHAYCTFCFRWPQFVGLDDLKFQMKDVEKLITYLEEHPEVTDVLFTGGDPMVMSTRIIAGYFDALIEARDEGRINIRTIRIGSKSLTYWPYKFVTDKGADEVLAAFQRVVAAGVHLAFMAHFNHPVELATPAAKAAIANIRRAGAVIRSQTPVMRGINDHPDIWADKWRQEVSLGVVPYYMFVARDTGAQEYFGVPLVRAHRIFKAAYEQTSGLCRTVRGPSMSAGPGKVEVLGPATVAGEKVLALRFLQGRQADWVARPFFAAYDEEAIWLDDLRPAFGEEAFFFEEDQAAAAGEVTDVGRPAADTALAPIARSQA
ncbi:MAG: KamA family radical SAM protein [Thermoplasmatota archaeon]